MKLNPSFIDLSKQKLSTAIIFILAYNHNLLLLKKKGEICSDVLVCAKLKLSLRQCPTI